MVRWLVALRDAGVDQAPPIVFMGGGTGCPLPYPPRSREAGHRLGQSMRGGGNNALACLSWDGAPGAPSHTLPVRARPYGPRSRENMGAGAAPEPSPLAGSGTPARAVNAPRREQRP